jgi:hypothetical protein
MLDSIAAVVLTRLESCSPRDAAGLFQFLVTLPVDVLPKKVAIQVAEKAIIWHSEGDDILRHSIHAWMQGSGRPDEAVSLNKADSKLIHSSVIQDFSETYLNVHHTWSPLRSGECDTVHQLIADMLADRQSLSTSS